jgi:hypothetical protein
MSINSVRYIFTFSLAGKGLRSKPIEFLMLLVASKEIENAGVNNIAGRAIWQD